MNAVIIDGKDNVAVVIEPVTAGDAVQYKASGEVRTLTALEDIMIYHKLAVTDIPKGAPIVKYGEHIGLASRDIPAGAHVHVHNVESHREAL